MPKTLLTQAVQAAVQQTTTLLANESAAERSATPQQAQTLRQALRDAQAAQQVGSDELKAHHAGLVETLAALEAARRDGSDTSGLDATLAEDRAEFEQARAARDAAAQLVLQRQRELVNALGTAAAWRHVDPMAPVALLPVRLETRWFARDAATYELRVRVFPDELHVDQHQRDPQPAEIDLARTYWTLRLEHGPEASAVLQAWETLCRQHGEARASWLAARLDPFGRGGRFEPGDAGQTPPLPALPVAPQGWQDMPCARALPDRWAVVGYTGGQRVLTAWSGATATELPMAPAPGAPGSETEADALAPDAGLQWMTDFAAAEALGMALRIPVPKVVARVLDRLLVFGVAASLPAADSAAALESLLASHAATGFGFVPHGAPTNNGEMEKSAYRSHETDHAEAHRRLTGHPAAAVPGSARALLARAFGIADAPLAGAWGADRAREPEVAAMHAALWPTSVGALLKQLAEMSVPQAAMAFAHEQFVQHVRAEGPLPALRVGDQPYGVLPVTSLARWKAVVPSVPATVLVNGLRSLQTYWERALRSPERLLPTIERGGLARVLSFAPGGHYDQAVQRDIGSAPTPGAAFWPAYVNALKTGPADITATFGGVQIEERDSTTTSDTFALGVPAVAAQADGTQALESNYIAALADLVEAGDTAALQAHVVESPSYLHLLLRSACREALATPPLPPGFVGALRTLATLPVATLETLLAEVADATGHRVDAWFTSVASARLAELRMEASRGLHLGAYGWLDGLVPPGEGVPANAALQSPPVSAGYIHMPSLAQARTAALLHGGHLANRTPEQADLFAIDLGADRVRAAKTLLDGLAQGRTLAGLLGHRLERRLHDSGQAALIPALRALAPGEGGIADGLALQARWHADPLDAAIPAAARPALADLHAAFDALGDLLLAEGVHQTANGNPVRAAAAFDALADGGALAAEPEVVQTPAPGRSFAQRLALLLPAEPAPGWPRGGLRAAAEPRLEGHAAQVLGAPESIRFSVTLTDGNGANLVRELTLADFELAALDVVAFAGEPLVELLRRQLIREGAADAVIDTSGLATCFVLAQALARLYGQARALADTDLQAAGVAVAATGDELAERAQAVQAELAALLSAAPDDAAAAWRIGLVAGPSDPETPDAAAAQRAELERRQARLETATDDAARIAAVLGANFRLLPAFTPQLGAAWSRVLADQPALTGGDGDEARRWLEDTARVRAPAEALDTLLTLHEAASGDAPALVVAHLPWQPGQRWVGQCTPDGVLPQASLVLHAPFGAPMEGAVAGLLVDSWAETVPDSTLVTGVALHFDEPKAQAPQAVLLAVPPDPVRGWAFEDIEATLLETLAFARTRGVGAEQIDDDDDLGVELGTYLPALYVFGDERAALKAA